MKTGFYPKLALDGIKKNKRLYLPYLMTCSGVVMMFYIIYYLASMPALDSMAGGTTTKAMLGFGVWVIAVFALLFLVYTNSFLMKRRQKEFGLYNILGMGKKNLSITYLYETVILFVMSMGFGLIGGIALSKLAEMGLVRMLGETVSYDFTLNLKGVFNTIVIFAFIFALLLIKGLISLWRLNPTALLKSENTGEKPPKANYLLGIAGIIILAAAYYIALTIKNPLLALSWFFIAVIMVIVATYMLFVSGSVVLCKALQKNKNYYYKKNHFVSVSSMAYRMKRNGAGLASICVLSTMILVMILGSGSLYFGAEDSLKARYPKEITVYTDYLVSQNESDYSGEKTDNILSEIDKVIYEQGTKAENYEKYLSTEVFGILEEDKLITDPETVNKANLYTIENVAKLYFVPLRDYNAIMGTNETLEDDEAMIHCVRCSYDKPSITIAYNSVLKIKKELDSMMGSSDAAMDIVPSIFLVVNDIGDVCKTINSEISQEDYASRITLNIGFDTEQSSEERIQLADLIRQRIRQMDMDGTGGFYSYSVESRDAQRSDFYATYGGLFYLGIILSIVFIIATVLIIYYKQVTEGYEDEGRFDIMQKVGMTKEDIRKSINSQMLTVFFLPLGAAALHLCFAFPMVQKLLALFNLRNTALMITVLGLSVLVFAVSYVAVYKITSNAYYKIVSGNEE